MTDAADALRRMQRQLIEAPENKFVEVVRVLEQAGDRPEVRQAIQAIRPRLAQVRPARRMTLKRVFCDPFEDMLEARGGGQPLIGIIPRRFIDPVWRETAARADPRHIGPMEQAVAALDSNDADGRHTLGCRLWYASAQALKRLIDEAPVALGAEMLAAARDILQYVEIGHQVATLKNNLPSKPILALDIEHCRMIEAAIQETAKVSPGKPFYLLLTVASRMRRPADLLAALQDMDFGKARREKPAIFAKLAGVMVDALEGDGERLGAKEGATPDPVSAVALAERLVESLDAASALLTGVGDIQYDERLKNVRQAVQTMVRRDVLAPAKSMAVAALPPPPAAGTALAAPDDDAQEAAEAVALSVRRCERFAGSLAIAPDVAATLAEIGRKLERDVLKWADSLGGRKNTEEDMEAAMLAISYAVRVLELTVGATRADALFNSALERIGLAT